MSIIMYGCYYRLNPNVSVIIYRLHLLWWNNLIEIVALLFYILFYAYCYNGPYLCAINKYGQCFKKLWIWMSNTCEPKLCNALNCWPYFLNAAVILGTFLTETLTSWSLLTKYPVICASTLHQSHLGLFLLQSYAKLESSAPARLAVHFFALHLLSLLICLLSVLPVLHSIWINSVCVWFLYPVT